METATSLQRGLIRPRWREVAVPVIWPVPEATVTVFTTTDDGCCDTRNMYSDFAVNKYLHTVLHLVGILLTYSIIIIYYCIIIMNAYYTMNAPVKSLYL